jgi:hypothetical protein
MKHIRRGGPRRKSDIDETEPNSFDESSDTFGLDIEAEPAIVTNDLPVIYAGAMMRPRNTSWAPCVKSPEASELKLISNIRLPRKSIPAPATIVGRAAA